MRTFLPHPHDFIVRGLRARLRVLWRVIKGDPIIDVYAFARRVEEVDELNHQARQVHIREIDSFHKWAGELYFLNVERLATEIIQAYKAYTLPNTKGPWEDGYEADDEP